MKDIWRGIVRKLKSKDDIRKQLHLTFSFFVFVELKTNVFVGPQLGEQ
jgi:hypothetical protein